MEVNKNKIDNILKMLNDAQDRIQSIKCCINAGNFKEANHHLDHGNLILRLLKPSIWRLGLEKDMNVK